MDQSRGFLMMGLFPADGVRPGAQIEIVVDLQLRCLEGGSLFQTQSGALQTPDWISNRHFVYAFDRHSGHHLWANRAYPEARIPLDVEKALTAYRDDWENISSDLPGETSHPPDGRVGRKLRHMSPGLWH